MRFLFLVITLLTSLVAHGQFITNNGITITNSNVVSVNDGWVNSGSLRNDGTIITTYFSNSGTLDNASTGGFVLTNTSPNSFSPGGSVIGFLHKQGNGDLDITSNLQIRDSLILAGGVVRLATVGTSLTLGNSGKFNTKVIAPGSWIEAPVNHIGSGDFLFPLGKDGLYLPIRFYKVSGPNAKVKVTLESAPSGYSAGPAVDALINFPYIWRAEKTNVTDTSSHVEISYPNTLPAAPNLVVARQLPGEFRYEGMGARQISEASGRVTVRSYSRRLNGVFTIATGFPGNFVTDSLALIALYETTGGASSWANKSGWTTGEVNTWAGITQTGSTITQIRLPNNNVSGPVPDQLSDILGLVAIDLSGNKITSIPDFSQTTTLNSFNVSSNNLDFESLIPNANIAGINYANQGLIGPVVRKEIPVGTDEKIKILTGGIGNRYQWRRNGQVINAATDSTYVITAINRSNMGEYNAEVTNPSVPNLVLTTNPQRIDAYASLAGRLLIADNSAATNGIMRLFKVRATGGYDTTAVKNINADGTFVLERIILDDYQLLGFADTVAHVNALPTYYPRTIFWEEADTLFVNDNINGLDIVSEFRPSPPRDGVASISGVLFDNNSNSGGRVNKQRVPSAGASVRRAERTGRGQNVVYTLVAYIFTNEDGEFNFDNLEPGEYRLNIQYPGYPMDEESSIDIIVGSTIKDRQAVVEAEINTNKISVRKFVIVGFEDETNSITVYPNPAVEEIFVDVQQVSPEKTKLKIFDSKGNQRELATSLESEKSRWRIDVSSLSEGLYILKIYRGETISTLKFIIR